MTCCVGHLLAEGEMYPSCDSDIPTNGLTINVANGEIWCKSGLHGSLDSFIHKSQKSYILIGWHYSLFAIGIHIEKFSFQPLD